jgi:toluene monooxygenase system protein E
MGAPLRPRRSQKTYWHLLAERRIPTDYELLTSRLHYYVGRGFEVEVPLADWYRQHQAGSLLQCSNWERFHDPRETTYARYTALQDAQETFVDGVLRSIEEHDDDRALPEPWRATLARFLLPMRYPLHGLQMAAAYVGAMAPSGRITVAALFQAADEMRRVQRIAYRMAQLRRAHPGIGDDARMLWGRDPAWQPLRELVERLLTTWDWGEAFAALQLCVAPILDELALVELAAASRAAGDYHLGQICGSLLDDGRWHRAWSGALVTTAVEERAENRAVLAGWAERWRRPSLAAAAALAPLLGDASARMERIEAAHREMLAALGLAAPVGGSP